MPGIAFVTGDTDTRLSVGTRSVQTSTTRPPLAHGGLREPEDLLVCGRALWIRVLVGLLHDLKVAALLARPVEDHAEPTAVALQRDDWYTLDLCTNPDVFSDASFAQAED